jgi:hypothetical protein
VCKVFRKKKKAGKEIKKDVKNKIKIMTLNKKTTKRTKL